MISFGQVGGQVDVTDGEIAGFLLFFTGLVMGPVVAVLANSLNNKVENNRIRRVQIAALIAFVLVAAMLFVIYFFEPSRYTNQVIFNLSGLGAIFFMLCVVGLGTYALLMFVRRNLLSSSKTQKRKSATKKRSATKK